MWKKTEDLSGEKFGKWLVLKRDSEAKCNVYWQCRCDCGLEKSVSGSHLRLGKSQSCRKCSEQKHKKSLNSRVWGRIVYGAKIRGLILDIGSTYAESKKFLYELLHEKQKSKCAISGVSISIADTIRGDQIGETTASLDRIDPLKGYTRNNVQWVHKWINLMKSDFTETEFIKLCESVVAYQKGKL